MKTLITSAAGAAALLLAADASAITIDASGYAAPYSVGGRPRVVGTSSVHLPPGDHWVDVAWGAAFPIHVAADGTVTTSSSAARASGDVLTFQTVDLTVDFGGVVGVHSIALGPRVDQETGSVRLLRGLSYGYNPAYGAAFVISLDDEGNVTSDLPAAEGDGHLLILHPVELAVDRGGVTGWHAVHSGPRVSAAGTLLLLPGLDYVYNVAYGAQFWMHVDDDGEVTTSVPAARGSLRRLDLEGTDIAVDTAGVRGFHSINTGGRVDPATGILRVVAGLDYLYSPAYGDHFTLRVDDAGNVTSSLPAAVGGYRALTYLPRWLDVTSSTTAYWSFDIGPQGSGTSSVLILPGLTYRFVSGGQVTSVALSDECTVTPDHFTSGATTYDLRCRPLVVDLDDDGVLDDADNCVGEVNPDQVDHDADGLGDACDLDLDGDGVENDADVCPELADPAQGDWDGDGTGDACDTDDDGDGVVDAEDNCLAVPNTDQGDSDIDGEGDACDLDDDDDGVSDGADVCPLIPDPDQVDGDGDGQGDACDGDDDADGVGDLVDACPATPLDLPVTGEGCSGAQAVARACPPESFARHGHLVSCVAHVAGMLRSRGTIDDAERARLVAQAAKQRP